MLGAAPPTATTLGFEQAAKKRPARKLERPSWKYSTPRPVPDVKGGPGVFLQHLIQPELISGIQGTASAKPIGHQLGDVAVSGDRHSDHSPLRHSGIVLVALERARIVFDL